MKNKKEKNICTEGGWGLINLLKFQVSELLFTLNAVVMQKSRMLIFFPLHVVTYLRTAHEIPRFQVAAT